jgi:type I restriction enzyme S subunit
MRVGWQTKTLGELCEIELGRTPPRASASFWDEKRETDNVWLSIADLLKAEDNFVVDSKEYLSDKGAAVCKLVRKGTLLVSFKLTLGRLAFAGRDLFTNEAIAALTILNEREISKEFLFYCLTFFDWVKAAENDVKLKGMTLNKAKLKLMPISFPFLPEQKRIVALLDESFACLATAKANAERNLQNARALFESHLQTVFSQRGEGWVEKPLGDVCELFQGLCINAKTKHLLVQTSSLPLLRIKDLRSNSAEQYVAESGWPKNAKVSEDEIIYTRTGQIGLVFRGRVGVLHNNCFKVRPKPMLNSDYFFWWLQSPEFRARITTLASKAAQPDITHSLFKVQPIQIPPREYQDNAIAVIDGMREETQHLNHIYERKLAALEELKKSLLHQAFNGEL